MRVAVFGGTTEGRLLSRALAAEGFSVDVFVATDYGREEQGEAEGIRVFCGRLNTERMEEKLFGADICVDATHPYAEEAHRTVREAAALCGVRLLRLRRPEASLPEDCITADSAEAAAEYLQKTEGNILLTTGVKELSAFGALPRERLFPRILPLHESLSGCEREGIPHAQIIAMQGPFTTEMNEAVIRQYGIKLLVTKEGGAAGGFSQKAEAARNTGARLIVIRRPPDSGLDAEAVLRECLRLKRERERCK